MTPLGRKQQSLIVQPASDLGRNKASCYLRGGFYPCPLGLINCRTSFRFFSLGRFPLLDGYLFFQYLWIRGALGGRSGTEHPPRIPSCVYKAGADGMSGKSHAPHDGSCADFLCAPPTVVPFQTPARTAAAISRCLQASRLSPGSRRRAPQIRHHQTPPARGHCCAF